MPSEADLRTLIAAGELRPDLFEFLGDDGLASEILLTAPGLMENYDGWNALARTPGHRLSKDQAFEHLRATLDQFKRAIDRLPHSASWEQRLRTWTNALDENVAEVRHFQRHPVHSRLISMASSSVIPQTPISPRLAALETELRLELRGAEHERARDWFRRLFDEALDISDEVANALRESWAGGWITPEEAYYFVLSQYFRDVISPESLDGDDNPLLEHLTEFQLEAYTYAKNILARYGGVFLADVVGLGKTFIAMALLAHLQRRYGEHAVVIAPPAVLPAWEALAREFRVELVPISIGKLEDLEQYADREVVVIDESHNFRNRGTQREETINKWLRPEAGAASNRKMILLSATPQNNSALDVEQQLRLFPDNFARIPFRGESLSGFFREVVAGRSSLVELLQHVVVRRTRNYIKSEYPDAKLRVRIGPGKYEERPLRFPTRISGEEQCLRYSIDRAYGGEFFQTLLDAIASMRYPLQGLGVYVAKGRESDDRLAGLRRSGASVRGLFRILLFKRLESSVHALYATLRRLVEKLEASVARLEAGEPLQMPGATRASDDADDSLDDATGLLPLELFDVDRLGEDLRADLETVRALIGKLEEIRSLEDEKLQRLERYLTERPPTSHKTIVFTQFAETAKYLKLQLGDRFGKTEYATGGGGALEKARRFAPIANHRPVDPEREIDLLISTDALSEGVNLQDADTLINYDLHWNPLRLIQRAGRIDRLSSEHEEIHISSFLPQRELEVSLGLEAVLRRRIDEFITVFGEDSQVLPTAEQPDPEAMASAYTGGALDNADASDEMDGLSRHMDRLYRLRRQEPDKFSQIQRLRPGRRALGTLDTSIAATRYDTYWEFWAPSDGDVARIDVRSAFDRLWKQAEAGSSNHDPPAGFGLSFAELARREFEPLAAVFEQERVQPKLSAHEKFVDTSLESLRRDAPETVLPTILRMQAWVLRGHAQAALRKQARIWKRQKLTPQQVFDELRPLLGRFPMPPRGDFEAELIAAVVSERSLEARTFG